MSRAAYGSHESAHTGSDVWLTPRHVIDALGPFDLDPCAAPEPRPWPTATRHIAFPQDGLRATWEGRVWLNPPYSNVWTWLAKLADHGDGLALIFARTETRGFISQVWRRTDGILFLAGRLAFCRPNGKPASSAGAPSCIVAYGRRNTQRLLEAAEILAGSVVTDWRSPKPAANSLQLMLDEEAS